MLRLRRFGQLFARDVEPTTLPLALPDRILDVSLRRRPGARRLTLRVSGASGAVCLTIPPSASLRSARQFLETQANWVAQKLAQVPDRIPFMPDAVIPLRGDDHRIRLAPGARAATRVQVDGSGERQIVTGGDADAVPGRIRRFLVKEADADLRDAVLRHTQTLGVRASGVTMRDTRSRWGSCSASGSLNFSWRLILAPPFVLDYLAAHEVAHLREMNHSKRFWAIVHDLCPATAEAERWLNTQGSRLHLYG